MAHQKRAGQTASKRQLRVAEEIRHALADVLMRGGLRDPELQGVSVTVAEVSISPDLKNATAYVSCLGGGESSTMVAALNRAAGWLRAQVAKQVRLKFAPALRFEADKTFDRAARIDTLLRETGGTDRQSESDDGA